MVESADAQFEACIDTLYGTLVNPASLPTAMVRIKALVDANAIAFIRTDRRTEVTRFLSHGYDPALPPLFVDHYASMDPGKAPMLCGQPGEWMQDDAAFDARYTPFPEYVADFAPIAGIRWLRGTKLHDRPDGGASVVSVTRLADARPFDGAAMARLQRLFPHLARVTKLHEELEALPRPGAASLAAVEVLATGVCAVDASLRVVYANEAALRAFDGSGPLRLHANRLSAHSAQLHARLCAAVALATGSPRQARSFSVEPEHGPQHRLQVRVLPLGEESSLANARGGPFALLFVAAGASPLRSTELGQLFGLTPSEAELVRLIAQGLSPAACAERRHVSVSTVRSQLKSVYAKTGVSALPQLLALVLALPGVLPAE